MNKLYFNNPIYITGDVHGLFFNLYEYLTYWSLNNIVLIVAGDCGIMNCTNWVGLANLEFYCKNNNIDLLFLRGNHDDPKYFKNNVTWSTIQCIPDYTIINDEILCIGGATSIDRKIRIQRHLKGGEQTYFEDEQPYIDKEFFEELHNSNINIKYVITHTCPSFCNYIGTHSINHWIENDPELEILLKNERQVMDEIFFRLNEEKHPLKHWIYGHFHSHDINSHLTGDIKYTMLDALIDEYSTPDIIELNN
jgi:DNA repair exonuclease SbcCD nuclease subunit